MSGAAPDEAWRRVDQLFHAALERGAAAAALLDAECRGDPGLRRQVEQLLDAHARAGRFLEDPAAPPALDDDEPAAVGRRIGPYRIVREIGRGGMGAVYLAERADHEYEKRVAIKRVRGGVDSAAVVRRFRAERQILASLDHPNIARMLDGGTDERGEPYLVMEHIEGRPIDEHCDAERLSIAGRLELFVQVCGAVAHAHQRLIVHRDIKPSNILIGPDGAPRLLDFGIAGLLDPTPGGEVTATTPILTPAYASPEQVQGRPATTLTDVYSLGVLLYELLCGRAPYDVDGRPPHEVAQIVCTADPVRPSAHGDRRLRGDLDAIALMALRKEPGRRHRSVEHLADDVRRHLRGMPVSARPETIRYRAGKLVGRHRAGAAAAALLVAALAGGIGATLHQAGRAREQERAARAAQARAERRFAEVRQLAHAVLFDYHDAIADLAGATPVRRRLVADALRHLDGLAAERDGDPTLVRELAAAYDRIGDVQGGPSTFNLGDTAGALASYRKAIALRETADPGATATRRDVAMTRGKLGTLLEQTGDVAGADAELRAAVALLEPAAAAPGADDATRIELARLHDQAGSIVLDRGQVAAALDHHRRAIAIHGALAPVTRAAARIRADLATAHEHLGSALAAQGDLEAALRENRAALDARAALAAELPERAIYRSHLAISHFNEGDLLARMGRERDALAAFERSAAISEALVAADPASASSLSFALYRAGEMLDRLARPREAVAVLRRARALRGAEARADPANLWTRVAMLEVESRLARALAAIGESAEAIGVAGEAAARRSGLALAPDDLLLGTSVAESDAALGQAYEALAARARPPERRERWALARDHHGRALAFWRAARERGLLEAGDAGRPDAAASAVARCDAALAGR